MGVLPFVYSLEATSLTTAEGDRLQRQAARAAGEGGRMHTGLLAWTGGTLIAVACVAIAVLAIYSIWFLFFKAGK